MNMQHHIQNNQWDVKMDVDPLIWIKRVWRALIFKGKPWYHLALVWIQTSEVLALEMQNCIAELHPIRRPGSSSQTSTLWLILNQKPSFHEFFWKNFLPTGKCRSPSFRGERWSIFSCYFAVWIDVHREAEATRGQHLFSGFPPAPRPLGVMKHSCHLLISIQEILNLVMLVQILAHRESFLNIIIVFIVRDITFTDI